MASPPPSPKPSTSKRCKGKDNNKGNKSPNAAESRTSSGGTRPVAVVNPMLNNDEDSSTRRLDYSDAQFIGPLNLPSHMLAIETSEQQSDDSDDTVLSRLFENPAPVADNRVVQRGTPTRRRSGRRGRGRRLHVGVITRSASSTQAAALRRAAQNTAARRARRGAAPRANSSLPEEQSYSEENSNSDEESATEVTG